MSVESAQFYRARKDDSEEMDYVRLKIPRSGHLTYIDLTHYAKWVSGETKPCDQDNVLSNPWVPLFSQTRGADHSGFT